MAALNIKPYEDGDAQPDDPDSLHILVSGFWQQRIVSTREVVEALEPIPNHHLEGLRVIKYDPTRTIQELMKIAQPSGGGERVLAEYYHMDPPGLLLYRFGDRFSFYRLLYHELGHYVYFKRLDQDLKVRWVHELYDPKGPFVSDYASLNACEDFAECYSAFCVMPQQLWKLPAKMRFIAEQVFYLDPGSYDFSEPDPPAGGVSPAYPELY